MKVSSNSLGWSCQVKCHSSSQDRSLNSSQGCISRSLRIQLAIFNQANNQHSHLKEPTSKSSSLNLISQGNNLSYNLGNNPDSRCQASSLSQASNLSLDSNLSQLPNQLELGVVEFPSLPKDYVLTAINQSLLLTSSRSFSKLSRRPTRQRCSSTSNSNR